MFFLFYLVGEFVSEYVVYFEFLRKKIQNFEHFKNFPDTAAGQRPHFENHCFNLLVPKHDCTLKLSENIFFRMLMPNINQFG